MALLDEIQRLVPGYEVSRLNLLPGNNEHTTALEVGRGHANDNAWLIVPAHNTLFTGRPWAPLEKCSNSVMENEQKAEVSDLVIE